MVVLEAAETLAGKPMEIRGLAGRQYFLAPSKELASLCRRWLSRTLPGDSIERRVGPEGQPSAENLRLGPR